MSGKLRRGQKEGVISFRRKLNDIRGGGRSSNQQAYSEPNGHVIDY